jgi:chorismate mutase
MLPSTIEAVQPDHLMHKHEAWPVAALKRPLLIAGPCSAETEEQVMQTAHQLKAIGTDIFRAGIWKPRTRPGSFEGIGSIGLQWLKRVQLETGMPVTIEVAKAKHVEEALMAGIDILWIGARTTANPFAVQEVADALAGVDIPVLVKNPVNPDVALWIGAVERVAASGISRIGAVHRGVSQYGHSIYRNRPEWQMAIEFRKAMPDLLLINDPSHIAGNRDLIQSVAQMALDLKFDGLMVETHITPDTAWSDSKQQVTPRQLGEIMRKLVVRDETPDGVELKSVEDFRSAINEIDDQLLEMLSYRMKVVDDIAQFKKQHNMTIFQEGRWNQLMDRHLSKAELTGLSEEFIIQLFRAIHQESINKQTGILNS